MWTDCFESTGKLECVRLSLFTAMGSIKASHNTSNPEADGLREQETTSSRLLVSHEQESTDAVGTVLSKADK